MVRSATNSRMTGAAPAVSSPSSVFVSAIAMIVVTASDVFFVVGFGGGAVPPMPFKWPVVGTLPDFLARGGVDRLREIYEASSARRGINTTSYTYVAYPSFLSRVCENNGNVVITPHPPFFKGPHLLKSEWSPKSGWCGSMTAAIT